MKCPRCGSNMVEKPPTVIYPTNPPQWNSVMWCACGHQEGRGRVYAPTAEQSLRSGWERANAKAMVRGSSIPKPLGLVYPHKVEMDSTNNRRQTMTTKTYKGKTGGGWLKGAVVQYSKAGLAEVWVGNAIATLTVDDTMVLADISGWICNLELSRRAARKLRMLTAKAESMMQDNRV